MPVPRHPTSTSRAGAAAACVAIASLAIGGCAGIAEGVTRALIDRDGATEPRPCEIVGPAFDGLASRIERHRRTDGARPDEDRNRVKVLMVHGIGTHPPGWSTRLQRNLVEALGLTIVVNRPKTIDLRYAPLGEEPLGRLTVHRYTDEAVERELLAYELSWSEITAGKKALLAYDTSGEHQYRRAGANHAIKSFLNDRLADPIAYLGESGERIIESVHQAVCWTAAGDWDDLPDAGTHACRLVESGDLDDLRNDEFVYVTHSLGSRIVADSLRKEIELLDQALETGRLEEADRQRVFAIRDAIQRSSPRIYMLANQLPLLDLARPAPEVAGAVDEYCSAGGARYAERHMSEMLVVAFSDPNDPLSYPLPSGYADEMLDSRLCPRTVDVSVNVTDVIDLFGVGEIAHPIKAHGEYEADPRVIGIIAGKVGNPETTAVVREQCKWLKSVDG
jgi:hypothetical protein